MIEKQQEKVKQLSAKHRVFVELYLQLWNQTEAYKRIYPKSSDRSARANATRLIANDSVAAEIKARLAEKIMSADEVLDRVAEQGRAIYSQYLMPNGEVDLRSLLADGKGHLIKKIKPGKYGNEIEFYDAHAARELIGKHHKLWTDKLDVDMHKIPFAADELSQSESELDEWTHKRQNGQESNG